MAEIEEVRAQTQQARQIIEQKKAEAQQIERELDEQERSLPQTRSQQALRQSYSGMQGRNVRQSIEGARKELQERKDIVVGYGQQVRDFEQEVTRVEQSIAGYESEQADYQEARNWFSSGGNTPISSLTSGARKYALQMSSDEAANRELFSQQVAEIQSSLPEGDKLIVDFNNMRVKGIESQGFGRTLSVDAYNKEVEKFNTNLRTSPEISSIQSGLPRFGDRIAQTRVSNVPRSSFSGDLLPLVSASQSATPMNPRTGKPYGTLTVAPNALNRLTSTLRPEKENIGTTIISAPARAVRYLGGEAGIITNRAQQGAARRGDKSAFYQSEGFINLASAAPQSVAIIPAVGVSLAVSSGAERAIKAPTIGGKSLGIAEAGLGIIGLRNQIKGFQAARELKAIERTPIKVIGQRVDNSGKGIDLLLGTKRVRNTQYAVKIQQPYFQAGKSRVSLEGGKGVVYRIKNNKITATQFESGGRITSVSSTPKIRKGILSQELRNLESGAGRLYTKPTKRIEYKIKQGFITPNKYLFEARGKASKINEPSQWQSFTGISRKGDGYFDIVSGQSRKIRYYPRENKLTILSRPENVGRIRTRRIRTDGDFFSGGRSLTTKKTISPVYSQSLLNQAIKQSVPMASKTNPSLTNTIGLSIKQTKVKAKQVVTRQENVLSLLKPAAKEDTKQRTFNKIRSVAIQRSNEKQNIFSGISQIASTDTKQRIRQGMFPRSVIKTQTKQKSGQRISTLMNNFFKQRTRNTTSGGIGISPKTVFKAKNGKIVKLDSGRYVVFVRRFGRDSIVGEAETLEEAKRILRLNLTSSLGASGFVTKGGKERLNIDLGFGFRPAKKERGRIVQESWFRLGSQSERREIQRARKQSNINWLGGGKGNKKKTERFKWW